MRATGMAPQSGAPVLRRWGASARRSIVAASVGLGCALLAGGCGSGIGPVTGTWQAHDPDDLSQVTLQVRDDGTAVLSTGDSQCRGTAAPGDEGVYPIDLDCPLGFLMTGEGVVDGDVLTLTAPDGDSLDLCREGVQCDGFPLPHGGDGVGTWHGRVGDLPPPVGDLQVDVDGDGRVSMTKTGGWGELTECAGHSVRPDPTTYEIYLDCWDEPLRASAVVDGDTMELTNLTESAVWLGFDTTTLCREGPGCPTPNQE